MNILVTGGLGYIGSHTCAELLNAGYSIIVLDNLSNSKVEVKDKIQKITGKHFKLYIGDIRDRAVLNIIFKENKIDAAVHFAGLKAVGESVEKPLLYYHNNVTGTLTLCEVMSEHNCRRIVFSSSATVYGCPASVPITEDFPLSTTNPYGSTKLMIENILRDLYASDKRWSIELLRYFNPIGAHESGLIGDDPNGIPNNLMPYITRVAKGKLPCLGVFGNDYPTHDGTGVRDYIHVVDLAVGHLRAIEHCIDKTGVFTFNLGTGKGYSVLDVVHAFERVNNIKINYEIKPRRAGDIAECYADPTKAKNELNWEAKFDIDRMCKDAWNFQQD
jgi:UDP-glucose 4-epimerase